MRMRWAAVSIVAAAGALRLLVETFAQVGSGSGEGFAPHEAAAVASSPLRRVAAVRSDPVESDEQAQRASAPPTTDAEALAVWFRSEVLRGLAKPGEAAAGPTRRSAGVEVDWSYVDDVLSGRVSGIPSERRAGLSLQELDAIGEIPYVERLRKEKRFDELRELGFENETIAWPVCLRTATCRLDRASSPPS